VPETKSASKSIDKNKKSRD